MKKIVYILIVISLYNCKSYNENKYSIEKQNYIYNFKGSFIRSCLKNGYNNHEIKSLLNNDKSYVSDFLLNEKGYKTIDSLSKSVYLEIKKDSMESIGKRAEGSEGKKVIEKCICFYESKKIDSIANVMYLKQK